MNRPKKYVKSARQILKESFKKSSDGRGLFIRMSLLPHSSIVKVIQKIDAIDDPILRQTMIDSLQSKSKM